jgi:transposase-like protein
VTRPSNHTRTRRTFTDEQKLAVVMRFKNGMKASEAGDLCEVGPMMVYRWARQYDDGTLADAKPAPRKPQPGAIARAAARALLPDQVFEAEDEPLRLHVPRDKERVDTLKRVLHTLIDEL